MMKTGNTQTSLYLYKAIKDCQRRVEYAISQGYDDFAYDARRILRAYTILESRANMLYERSAQVQLRKLQAELREGL